MPIRHGLQVAVIALMLSSSPAMTAALTEERRADAMIELPGDGPYRRFIVKYRAASAPGRDAEAVQARLDRAVAATGLTRAGGATPLSLTWQRRLAVQADVLQADRPLEREEARRLLRQLAADPDVEYVEVDAMMGIGPVRGNDR